jgi:hypothetical protein
MLVHAAAADHFEVDIRTLVKMNLPLFEVTRNMTYKYQTILQRDEMIQTLDVVQKVTQGVLGTPTAPIAGGGAIEPYFVCTNFNADGNGTQILCDEAALQPNSTSCAKNGTASGGKHNRLLLTVLRRCCHVFIQLYAPQKCSYACSLKNMQSPWHVAVGTVHTYSCYSLQVACMLYYTDVNVTQLAPGSRIRMCKPTWNDTLEFNKVAVEVETGTTDKRIPEAQEVRDSCGGVLGHLPLYKVESPVANAAMFL